MILGLAREPVPKPDRDGTEPTDPPFVTTMPLYFFDTHDGDTYLQDDEGQDLDGIEEVRLQAQSGLADMARDVVPGHGPERTMADRVRDGTGKTVLRGALVLMVEVEE